jgi:hypothetical protein
MMASQLRKKFENHLILSRLSANTQEAYIKAVEGLAFFYNQSPDKLGDDPDRVDQRRHCDIYLSGPG